MHEQAYQQHCSSLSTGKSKLCVFTCVVEIDGFIKYLRYSFQYSNNRAYLIVESVSFVLHRDLSPINPKKTIEIINSRALSYIALVRGQYIDNALEFIISIVFETSSTFK